MSSNSQASREDTLEIDPLCATECVCVSVKLFQRCRSQSPEGNLVPLCFLLQWTDKIIALRFRGRHSLTSGWLDLHPSCENLSITMSATCCCLFPLICGATTADLLYSTHFPSVCSFSSVFVVCVLRPAAYLAAVLTDLSVTLLATENRTKPHSACTASGSRDLIVMTDEGAKFCVGALDLIPCS